MKRVHSRSLLVLLFAGIVGCGHPVVAPHPVSKAALPSPVMAPAPAKAIDYASIKANEAGWIPVLMYHSIGAPAYGAPVRYDRHGYNIRPETFRHQLELMYDAGWYPVNMRDALSPRMDVPAGKTPVVLTFDDARGSQLYYLKDGSIDPTCAVAILEQFHLEHSDWPLRGTFYVLPKSRWNPAPFYQAGKEAAKLNYLIKEGFEVANHSTSHRMMTRMNADTLRWEMAECVRDIKKLAPSATMDTMALPYGGRPRNRALIDVLLTGSQGGTSYANLCVLDAWGGPNPSPVSKKFDKREILRIGAEPGYIEGWIKRLRRGGEFEPYVSDGEPDIVSVPKRAGKMVDKSRLAGARLAIYDDGSGKKLSKVARKKDTHG